MSSPYTYKNQFNKKYGFEQDTPHSLTDISKITDYKKSGLQTIFNKGVGAFKTNPTSVRPGIRSPEQWAQARVYSAVMGGKSATIDKTHLIRK
jgi:hypothetical protein